MGYYQSNFRVLIILFLITNFYGLKCSGDGGGQGEEKREEWRERDQKGERKGRKEGKEEDGEEEEKEGGSYKEREKEGGGINVILLPFYKSEPSDSGWEMGGDAVRFLKRTHVTLNSSSGLQKQDRK